MGKNKITGESSQEKSKNIHTTDTYIRIEPNVLSITSVVFFCLEIHTHTTFIYCPTDQIKKHLTRIWRNEIHYTHTECRVRKHSVWQFWQLGRYNWVFDFVLHLIFFCSGCIQFGNKNQTTTTEKQNLPINICVIVKVKRKISIHWFNERRRKTKKRITFNHFNSIIFFQNFVVVRFGFPENFVLNEN